VYTITLPTVRREIYQADHPTPAEVSTTEAARVDNEILFDYFTSAVAHQGAGIETTDQNIPIDTSCPDDKLHFGMRGGCEDYDNEGDTINTRDAIPTASRP